MKVNLIRLCWGQKPKKWSGGKMGTWGNRTPDLSQVRTKCSLDSWTESCFFPKRESYH